MTKCIDKCLSRFNLNISDAFVEWWTSNFIQDELWHLELYSNLNFFILYLSIGKYRHCKEGFKVIFLPMSQCLKSGQLTLFSCPSIPAKKTKKKRFLLLNNQNRMPRKNNRIFIFRSDSTFQISRSPNWMFGIYSKNYFSESDSVDWISGSAQTFLLYIWFSGYPEIGVSAL